MGSIPEVCLHDMFATFGTPWRVAKPTCLCALLQHDVLSAGTFGFKDDNGETYLEDMTARLKGMRLSHELLD